MIAQDGAAGGILGKRWSEDSESLGYGILVLYRRLKAGSGKIYCPFTQPSASLQAGLSSRALRASDHPLTAIRYQQTILGT